MDGSNNAPRADLSLTVKDESILDAASAGLFVVPAGDAIADKVDEVPLQPLTDNDVSESNGDSSGNQDAANSGASSFFPFLSSPVEAFCGYLAPALCKAAQDWMAG